MTVTGLGEKAKPMVTTTVRVSGAKPVAVAVICAVPIRLPVTCGFATEVCKPAGTKTLDVTDAIDGSLLVKLIVKPLLGAGVVRLTGKLKF